MQPRALQSRAITDADQLSNDFNNIVKNINQLDYILTDPVISPEEMQLWHARVYKNVKALSSWCSDVVERWEE